jgi:transcription elongation factor Elf1
MPNVPFSCPACGALVTQIGVMCGLGDHKLRRTLICIKGHVLEDGPATNVQWSKLAEEEELYDKVVDSSLLPYASRVIARRKDGRWSIVKSDGALGEPAYPVDPCKFCQSTDVSLIKDEGAYVLSCDGCDAYGPEGESFVAAAKKWNGRG